MSIQHIELSPKDREYIALVNQDHRRRLGLLFGELGVPSGVQVTFDEDGLTFVLPDPPATDAPPSQPDHVEDVGS